ncbi:type III pantothenate kinase [Pseudothauera nasutitermitis]|uniref:Type III pantothenate kinase n=1 Tax=Pseudothauera nasutitermitis TaxID=2565930 RepID=A0A4S4AV34_9RHOO|nr:type III pantothenate kinase [Pseudothauera nasutitermitis]THF63826.1 type III pantothenate kinase [Pseudothauera nasutitermitis]
MILLLDAGNTRIKWRLVAAAAPADTTLAEGDLEHAGAGGLAGVVRAHPGIVRIVGSNVAGAALGEVLQNAVRGLLPPIEWLLPGESCAGVRNGYLDPAQLGADRWAALIGARRLHTGPCLVVCAGTATTLNLMNADGLFEGGLILPGMDLMLRALAGNTAQLPLAEAAFTPVPRTTAEAIVSGCLHAQAGAVERMFERIAGQPDALCLLSGGGAGQFADLLRVPLRRVDNLVLDGLAIFAHNGPQATSMG